MGALAISSRTSIMASVLYEFGEKSIGTEWPAGRFLKENEVGIRLGTPASLIAGKKRHSEHGVPGLQGLPAAVGGHIFLQRFLVGIVPRTHEQRFFLCLNGFVGLSVGKISRGQRVQIVGII